MSKERDFLSDSNYSNLSNFTRVKYGINRPILETELNEMQKIQEDARASLIRQIVPTGFLELKRRDFLGESIVFNPNNDDNSIAFAPADLIVNGYEIKIEGKDKVDNVTGYTVVDLGDAPYSSTQYYDFIFLEVWFEELNSQSNIYKHGHVDGVLVKNNMIDSRVQEETSRRVGIRYKVRVEKGINLEKWNTGFGYNNAGDYSRIYASGPKSHDIENIDYLFLSATDSVFKGLPFYGDNGLYVAGRPGVTTIRSDFGILDDYIFAVPLFAVKRRNQKPYSIDEPNGAPKYYNPYTASERPDGLFHNRIVSRDIRDLRKVISFNQLNTTKLLDDSLKKLFTGELYTKEKEVVERIQFGAKALSAVDQSTLGVPILYAPFSKTTVPNYGPTSKKYPTDKVEKYDLAATGYGLIVDGTYDIRYRPVDLVNWISKNFGTIEFFIKPFWDGADETISQTLFEITDDLDNALMVLRKNGSKLILTQRFDATKDSDETNTVIDLTKQNIYYNGIYHIRVVWDRNNNKTSIFINGKEIATGWFLLSALNPTTIKIGKVESVDSYFMQRVGCIIDEFALYSTVLDPTKFPLLESDVINGHAKIYQSFNGSFRSFKDNSHLQSDIIADVLTTSGNKMILEAPYNTIINGDITPIVYNKKTGVIYTGNWSGLNTNKAAFTLDGSQSFNGEIVWVQHSVIVPNGSGIDNLPTKILKAEMNGKSVSFTSSNEIKREVQLVDKDYIIEANHKAWDYSTNRDENDAFARIVNYRFNSNGTNKYLLPKKLYERNVMGIKFVDRPLRKIYKNHDGDFVIELEETVIYGDYFTIDVALDGYTFDYDSHSKSIVSNMMIAKTITVKGTGDSDTLVIPTSDSVSSNGGVIVSFLGVGSNEIDELTNQYKKFDRGEAVYYDSNMIQPISISGIGTPFITLKFDFVPRLDSVIEIPVLLTYQPTHNDRLSVWYEYVPYQGILDSKPLNLKRFTDWKIFSTTLGSGNIFVNNLKENSINNAVNRLPGGQKFAYLLNGDDIEFENEKLTPEGSYSANKKLVFKKDFTDKIDSNEFDTYFNSLNTDIKIVKMYGNHQDSKINTNLLNSAFYVTDTKNAINKYMGAACLVVDDSGNVLMLIIGEIKKDPTINSIVEPVHGDVFKLENSPIILTRRF